MDQSDEHRYGWHYIVEKRIDNYSTHKGTSGSVMQQAVLSLTAVRWTTVITPE